MNLAHLISLWLIWSNDRTDANALPGEPPLNLDHNYITDSRILDEFHGDNKHVFNIRCYVDDELGSFDLIAVYGPDQLLLALLTEVDTTWFTIYTNEEN